MDQPAAGRHGERSVSGVACLPLAGTIILDMQGSMLFMIDPSTGSGCPLKGHVVLFFGIRRPVTIYKV